MERSHHSINECLQKGPNFDSAYFSMSLRFRMHQIGITADIEKAFHQIMINPDDLKPFSTDFADWCLVLPSVQLFYKVLFNITYLGT